MSLWQREQSSIGIGVNELCRLDTAGQVIASHSWDVRGGSNDQGRAQHLAAALRAVSVPSDSKSKAKMRVVVADSLARYWLMETPADVRSLSELQAVAQARSHQLFGVTQRWQIAADWNARHPFLCAAIPEYVNIGVRDVMGATGQMESALPLVLRQGLGAARHTWLCATSPGSTAILGFTDGRPRSVRVLPTGADDSLDAQLRAAARELRRESLRTGMPLSDSVQWWALEGQSAQKDGVFEMEIDGMRFVPRAAPDRYRRPPASCSDAQAAAAMAWSF